MNRTLWLLLVIALSGCASRGLQPSVQDECTDLAQYWDAQVLQAELRDGGPRLLPSYPYFRLDRFHASFAELDLNDEAQKTAWLSGLRALDQQSWQSELMNLGLPARKLKSSLASLAQCGERAKQQLLINEHEFRQFHSSLRVSDDYVGWRRWLGAYPLAVPFLRAGVKRWHEEAQEIFDLPPEQVPVEGQLRRYRLLADSMLAVSADELAQSRDALGVPRLSAQQWQALFAQHAPIFELDQRGDFDQPGSPQIGGGFTPESVLYLQPSYTRFRGRVLAQLNYLIWFSERPKTHALDILGGRLDGLIWRVTLDERGVPLLYDSIHSCGCYHYYFAAHEGLSLKPGGFWSEPLLMPKRLPVAIQNGKPWVLRVSSGAHYLQSVYAADDVSDVQPLMPRDYQQLRSLPSSQGRRSLFGRQGLVAGTQRLERWILWPSGVPSPGAMRQWGRHATAFIGRRHFDDAELLDNVFQGQQ